VIGQTWQDSTSLDSTGRPLAFVGRLSKTALRAQSSHAEIIQAAKRLLWINASAFPMQTGMGQADHNKDYRWCPPDFGTAVATALDSYSKKEGDGSVALKALGAVSDKAARGIITLLNPLKDSYRHGAFLGEWTGDIKVAEKAIWLEKWMTKGERKVSEGRLFKEIYNMGFGAVLVVNWTEAAYYVSDIPRQISLRWVLVVPVLHFGECVGTFTCDFEAGEIFDGSWTAGARPSKEFTKKAAYLYCLAHLAVAPLIMREAVGFDAAMMDSVARALQPPMRTTFETLNHVSDRLVALQKDGRHICDVREDLSRLAESVQREARRGLGHVNALRPQAPPFRVETCDIEVSALSALVEPVWREVVTSEANPGFGWMIAQFWLRVRPNIRVWELPLPRWVITNLLRELLSNAYHAVCERQSRQIDPSSEPAPLPPLDNPSGAVRVSILPPAELGKIGIQPNGWEMGLGVADRGISMSPHARARSRRFGFSGRDRGSGWGLAIVERQMKTVNGALHVRPGFLRTGRPAGGLWQEGEGGCSATMVFPRKT
jgi:hypothetical protein